MKNALAGSLVLILFGWIPLSAQSDAIQKEWQTKESRQFDFWIGKWDVNLRMIQNDKTWKDSVRAKVEIYPILDGKAILELWDSAPIKGFSLRYFDTDKKKWVLYLNWPSQSRSSIGSLEGSFRHGRGEFFSNSKGQDGKTLISRYTFCDITEKSLRWDDAFSRDGGKTWTNNWIMEFTRSGKSASWPQQATAHTFATGKRCRGDAFENVNALAGRWRGRIAVSVDGKPKQVAAKMNVYKILDGCSVIRFLEFELDGETHRSFGLVSYNRALGNYEELILDNRPGTKAHILRGKINDGSLSLTAKIRTGDDPVFRKHEWKIPADGDDQLQLMLATSKDGKNWSKSWDGTMQRDAIGQKTNQKTAINRFCPRSGKPVSKDSLTQYRGKTVGFCNQHCRDDFAANIKARPRDREFFDKIIDDKD